MELHFERANVGPDSPWLLPAVSLACWQITPNADPLSLGHVRHLAESDKDEIYVLRDDQTVLAMAHIGLDDAYARRGEYTLIDIAVRPEYQRRGIGRLLVERMEQRVMERGGTALKLYPIQAARPFYEQQGYVRHPEDDGDLTRHLGRETAATSEAIIEKLYEKAAAPSSLGEVALQLYALEGRIHFIRDCVVQAVQLIEEGGFIIEDALWDSGQEEATTAINESIRAMEAHSWGGVELLLESVGHLEQYRASSMGRE